MNTYDNKGGAARASFRLAKAIDDAGIDVSFVVRKKNLNYPFIEPVGETFPRIRPYIDYLPSLLFTRKRLPFFSAILKDNLKQKINERNPDIIHLNWISEGFIKTETLAKLDKPIIWTLHDSWAFTGGCHMPKSCIKYRQICENCQYLSPKMKKDLSYYNFKRKLRTYSEIKKLIIVTPSKWLADEVRSSALLGNRPVYTIPNCIDNSFLQATKSQKDKKHFSLDPDKKTILFGGVNPTKDENKGYDLLLKSLGYLEDKNVELVIFGDKDRKTEYHNSIKTIFMGRIKDDSVLRDLYSVADLTVVPSLSEVFGQVITESMACGTPVVTFDTTGPKEIIDHKKNGYMAKAFNPKDLAEGIKWILYDKKRWDRLSEDAVRNVSLNFSSDVVAKKYIDLYKNVLM